MTVEVRNDIGVYEVYETQGVWKVRKQDERYVNRYLYLKSYRPNDKQCRAVWVGDYAYAKVFHKHEAMEIIMNLVNMRKV